MKINYSYSANQPALMQSIGTATSPKYQINFDTEELSSEDIDGKTVISYRSLYVQVKSISYADVLSAIIQSRYSDSEITSIVMNNMQANDINSEISQEKRKEYISEYTELQSWRKHAKEIASSLSI